MLLQMVNKMEILGLDHFLLVMQKLAHFHGRWLTYRWMGEAGTLPQAILRGNCPTILSQIITFYLKNYQ